MTAPTAGRIPQTRVHMHALAVLYVVGIAAAAQCSGWHYLLFPALAAVADDVLTRPCGRWASQPGRLIVTPTLGAIVGMLITRQFGYQVWSLLLVVALCVLLLAALRSNIAPTIAAGLLPFMLDITSWMYPVSIMLGFVGLVIVLLPWRRHNQVRRAASPDGTRDVDDVFETHPTGTEWVPPYFLFLTIIASCAMVLDLRLLLVPPLVVIAYEMFTHPALCPWALRPVTLPVACAMTATAGWLAVVVIDNPGIAAGVSMLAGIAILRLLRLHLPPALAIGLLPLVISTPDIKYPLSVAVSAMALMLGFLLYRRWLSRRWRGSAGRNVSPA